MKIHIEEYVLKMKEHTWAFQVYQYLIENNMVDESKYLLSKNTIEAYELSSNGLNMVTRGNSTQLSKHESWYLINKNVTTYTLDQWLNIFKMSQSSDLSCLNVAISLLKNVCFEHMNLGVLAYSLINRHVNKIKANQDMYNSLYFLQEMYYRQNMSKPDFGTLINLSTYKCPNKDILGHPEVIEIFTNVYKHYLSFGEIKLN